MLPGLDVLTEKTLAAIAAEDPTAILLADHEWLRDVIEAYRHQLGTPGNLAEVQAAMLELKPRLELHIRREEEAYFPAVEAFMQESGQGSTFDMYGEHDAIRIRLEELLIALDRQSMESHAYGAFSRSILVHFENEEELIFAEAPAHLTDSACRDILKLFEALSVADPQ
ncbi:MAG TPA: hemerythrin domain-containing protein [Dehalococcoidia bacterium]|nr:hemerythrin domain-containing protein [Dehalococcoidia bacterium]